MAEASKHDTGTVAESLHVENTTAKHSERKLGTAWAFETLEPTPIDSPHPNSSTNWGPSKYMSPWWGGRAILIQTTSSLTLIVTIHTSRHTRQNLHLVKYQLRVPHTYIRQAGVHLSTCGPGFPPQQIAHGNLRLSRAVATGFKRQYQRQSTY